MRITEASSYVERRDSISHDWIHRLGEWGMTPLLIPNVIADVESYVQALDPDLVVLTGGEDLGRTPERDQSEARILGWALGCNVPVLGVCRGLQFINQRFGGSLERIAGHTATSHAVLFASPLTDTYGAEAIVNSYHAIGVSEAGLGRGLHPCARDADGLVEALFHDAHPVLAVMWHPERDIKHAEDRILLEKLAREGAFWR